MTREEDTSGNFGKPFWKHSLSCNDSKICLLGVVCETESQMQRFGSRAMDSIRKFQQKLS